MRAMLLMGVVVCQQRRVMVILAMRGRAMKAVVLVMGMFVRVGVLEVGP